MVWELAGDLVGLLGARQIHAAPADQAAFRERHLALRAEGHDQLKVRVVLKKGKHYFLRALGQRYHGVGRQALVLPGRPV